LEAGDGKPARGIAREEGIGSRYVVNLTTLASDIVAVILDKTVPPNVTLFDLGVDPPLRLESMS